MPFDFNSVVGNFMAQQLTNTAENQKVEQMKTQTASEQLKLAQYQQLAPLMMEQQKAQLQGEIDQQAIKTSLLPLQREMARDAISNAAISGNPNTTGDPFSDAEIARVNQQTQYAMAMNPNEIPALMGTRAKAIREIREQAQEVKKMKLSQVTESIGEKPLSSVIDEARRQPNDPHQAFITQYMQENPSADKEDLIRAMDRQFGMTPYQRTTDERQRENHQDTMANVAEAHEQARINHEDMVADRNRLRAEQERKDRETERLRQEAIDSSAVAKQEKAAQAQQKRHEDFVDKYVGPKGELDRTNSLDSRRGGVADKIHTINQVKTIAGDKPVTYDNILDSITAGAGKNMTGVYTNQVQTMVALNATLSKDFNSTGQGTVKKILEQEHVTGILPSSYRKLDAWLLGQGNPQLNSDSDAKLYAKMTEVRYNLAQKEVGDQQLGKILPVYTRPGIPPELISNTTRNVLNDPRNVPVTKAGTIQAMAKNLQQNGVEMTDDDKKAFGNVAKAFLTDTVKQKDKNIMIEGLVKTYEKYATQLPHTSSAPVSTPSNVPTMAGIPSKVSPSQQHARDGTRAQILQEELSSEQANLQKAAPGSEEYKAAQRNINALTLEMRRKG